MTLPLRNSIRTGIGRPLDFRYRSNRFVVVATTLAGLGALLWQWSAGSDDIAHWSMGIAGGVFLAWAIGRELDPDDTTPAALATIVVLPLIALGRPSLGSSAAALIGIRIAVRTTGLSPQRIDAFALALAAGYLGTQPEAWPGVVVMVVAMSVDRFAHPRGPERALWFGAVMALVAVMGAVAFSSPTARVPPTGRQWGVLAVTAIAAALAVVNTRVPGSRGDILDEVISQQRLRLGRCLALLALVVGVIYPGEPVAAGLSPLWAAILSVTMVFCARPELYRQRSSSTEEVKNRAEVSPR